MADNIGRMAKRRKRTRKRVRRYLKGVPFLPSLLTLGNAFCGFLAIVKISDAARVVGETGQIVGPALELVETACLLIFLAMAFDGLDGKVARLTHSTSEFGAQLDSLADALTFGVAPAVIAKFLIDVHQAPAPGGGEPLAHQLLPFHPRIYYVCAALYVLFAILRLARFNVEVTDPDEKAHLEFEGLPSPAAALAVVSLAIFWCAREGSNSLTSGWLQPGAYDRLMYGLPFVVLGAGLLMVSRLPYPHLLNVLLRRKRSFPSLVAAVVLLILGVLEWQVVVLTLATLYVVSGPLIAIVRMFTGGRRPHAGFVDEDEVDDGDEFEDDDFDDEHDEHDDEAADGAGPSGDPRVVRGPGAVGGS